MSYKTASCTLCNNPRPITAEQQQWRIHLAKHREDLTKYLTENFSDCVLCDIPMTFSSQKNFVKHLKWDHSKKSLIDWFYRNLVMKPSSNF